MYAPLPLTRDLVLIGGGHTHALVLRMWGMKPLPGVRLTVINPGPTAPYSGMLPGHIAGHYSREELEIDLVQLARFAGARVILDRAVGLNRAQKQIILQNRPPISYDIASVDIGITSDMAQLAGFADHAIGAKPLDRYSERWRDFRAEVKAGTACPTVVVIGGGIAGIELSMAMAHALRTDGALPSVTVIEGSDAITGVPPSTSRRLMRAMKTQDVRLLTGTLAAEVTAKGVQLADGSHIDADLVVGAAGTYPHPWLAETDLPLTDGFIDITPDLQVTDDPSLFACGDCANMAAFPRPKAGVFAVRAAPFLYHNLRAALTGHKMKPFKPQSDYLKLVSLGGKAALAEKAGITVSGKLLWAWKNRIDTQFMRKFSQLPTMAATDRPAEMAEGVADILDAKPLCGGCGAKVGAGVLGDTLKHMSMPTRPDVVAGPGDDAAVLRIGDVHQVITTDHLRAFTQDPYVMAQITAVHALGDVWAMGATPQAALAQIILPRMSPELQARTMDEIMRAASGVFAGEGVAIVGGHSTMGDELTIGFTLTGLRSDLPITTAGAKAGDVLLLTRPIGSGTVMAAEMQKAANGRHVAQMLDLMARPQGDAAKTLSNARAMTDVTGFGLAGHLMEICRASELSAELTLDNIPVFDGAVALAEAGHHSTLYQSNRDAAPVFGAEGPKAKLIYDPQTAGGLLAAVDPADVQHLVNELTAQGHTATIIGRLAEGPASITLR